LVVVLIGELTIGMAFGFVGRLVFTSLEFASHFLSSQMGFSLAGTIDPSTKAQTTAFGTISQMLGLMVLLSVNGHHWFLAATVQSFSTTAPGSFALNSGLLDTFLHLSSNALNVGVSLAAPAIIVLLAVEFALEFFGRTAPQFQVFILGLPIKIGIALWLVGASIYFLPTAFRGVMSGIFDGLAKVLNTM
jgi:flagellar biosynthetic protein FliR